MNVNEWGVKPGSQDNLLPEDAPMLSEMECDLINLFRSLPADKGKTVLKALFEIASNEYREAGN